jgi:hypothetical protein
MGELITITFGLGILSWVFSAWSSARKECSQKLREWKEQEKKIKELLSIPASEDNSSPVVAQCHNCKRPVTINAKTKEKLQKTLEEWKKYEDEVKFHRVASIFGLTIAVADIILMVYEAFIFILDWKLPAVLKPYEELMGIHLLFGWVIVLGAAGVFVDPPLSPDEKTKFQTPEEEVRRKDLFKDDDRDKYSTTVREPYSSIYGMEPSTHRD